MPCFRFEGRFTSCAKRYCKGGAGIHSKAVGAGFRTVNRLILKRKNYLVFFRNENIAGIGNRGLRVPAIKSREVRENAEMFGMATGRKIYCRLLVPFYSAGWNIVFFDLPAQGITVDAQCIGRRLLVEFGFVERLLNQPDLICLQINRFIIAVR